MYETSILVVDDEMIVRRVIGDALAGAGYKVETAGDPAAALQILQHQKIDLILLDLQLGDSNGIDLLKQIRRRDEFLPVIILTAHGSLPSAIEAVRQAVADYLLKPVRMEALRQRVAEVLATHKTRHNREHRIKAMYENLQALMQEEGLIKPETTSFQSPADSFMQGRKIYEVEPLLIDVAQHMVRMHGEIIEVTPTEFAILLELARQPGYRPRRGRSAPGDAAAYCAPAPQNRVGCSESDVYSKCARPWLPLGGSALNSSIPPQPSSSCAASAMWRALMPAASISSAGLPDPGRLRTARCLTRSAGISNFALLSASSTALPRPPSGR